MDTRPDVCESEAQTYLMCFLREAVATQWDPKDLAPVPKKVRGGATQWDTKDLAAVPKKVRGGSMRRKNRLAWEFEFALGHD